MKPVTALIILDGFGCRQDKEYNAILTDGAAHIRALAAAGVDAAVVGKSLYEGGITLAEALDACSE